MRKGLMCLPMFVMAFINTPVIAQITTNLPIVKLAGTITGTESQGTLAVIDNLSGINNENDAPTYTGMIGVRIRGNASATKPSYALETWSAPNTNVDVSLLGMPAENDWVLMSSYNDRSFTRMVLSNKLHESMGRYAPRFKHCELIVNGTYEGIYLFGEKIKRDTARLDLANLKNIDNSGSQLTGGYIWTLNEGTPDWTSLYAPPFGTGQQVTFNYDTPDPSVITPAQKAYIKAYVDSFELALNSANFQDTLNGWRRYGAVGSFVDFMLINEVSKNYDAYRTNQYMFKDRDKKLRPGPLWGFDLAWKNTADCNAAVDTGFMYHIGGACPTLGNLPPFWWKKLTSDTSFMKDLKCAYREYRFPGGILDTAKIFYSIDSISNRLNANGAIGRNFTKWPIWGVPLNNEPTPMATNHVQEVANLKQFIKNRLAWLDGQWQIAGTKCPAPVAITDINAAQYIRIYPNPTNSGITLCGDANYAIEIRAIITDIYGAKVKSVDPFKVKTFVDLSELPSGVYFLNLFTGNSKSVQKIIKQ